MGRGNEAQIDEPVAESPKPVPRVVPQANESEDQRIAREQAQANLTPEEIKERFPSRNTATSEKTPSQAREKDVKEKEEKETKDLTTDSDTARFERDDQTWTPTLLRAPLPSLIIDELRGKYSKFRTRHEPEFLQKIQRIDSAKQRYEAWAKQGGKVLETPQRESLLRAEAKRKEASKLRGRVLNDEVLEGIGKLMWDRGMRLSEKDEFEAAQRWKQTYGSVPKESTMVKLPKPSEMALLEKAVRTSVAL